MSNASKEPGASFKKARNLAFCLDENIHPLFAKWLQEHGRHEVTFAAAGAHDEDVLRLAAGVLVTHDHHFDDAKRFRPGKHKGIIVLDLASKHLDAVLAVFSRFQNSGRASEAARNIAVLHESDFLIRSSRGTESCRYER